MITRLHLFYGFAASIFAVCLVLHAIDPSEVDAISVTSIIRPTSTGTFNGWNSVGTGDSSCSGLCDFVDESTADGDTTYLSGPNGQAPSIILGMGNPNTSGQTATSITVYVTARSSANSGLGYPPVTISLTIGGSTIAATNVTFNSNAYQVRTGVFTGSWTKAQVDAATVTILKGANGLQPGLFMTQVYAEVAYSRPSLTQSNYRLYSNQNSTTPAAALAASNTAVETAKDVPFRLRMGVSPGDVNWETGTWGPHNNLYKLQYSQLTAASCSAQATGWTDVASGSGAIRWYDNTSVADGATLSDMGSSDVSVSGARTLQAYRESNSFPFAATTSTGNTAIWDFPLVSSNQAAGLSFCFRIINGDNTLLDSYSAYPRVTLTGDLGVLVVDQTGAEVTSPSVPFSSAIVSTTGCSTTTGSLGTSTQKIRVSNALVTNGWSVSIAAENPTNLWTSGASYYDFNDSSGCTTDGGDADSWPGQLTVGLGGATITPSSGCNNTGISSGSGASFVEGSVNAITLLSATSSSQRFCYWDLTGVSLSQSFPSKTPAGSYGLGMVITVLAQ